MAWNSVGTIASNSSGMEAEELRDYRINFYPLQVFFMKMPITWKADNGNVYNLIYCHAVLRQRVKDDCPFYGNNTNKYTIEPTKYFTTSYDPPENAQRRLFHLIDLPMTVRVMNSSTQEERELTFLKLYLRFSESSPYTLYVQPLSSNEYITNISNSYYNNALLPYSSYCNSFSFFAHVS